ncbi:MAG: hypothetical protein H7832_09525 [Magnetococcus sp. DMHC-6]
MMISFRIRNVPIFNDVTSFFLFLFLLLVGWISNGNAENQIPWKNETFTKSVFEEDVRVILTEILQRNGQEVVFKPDVHGEVTLELHDIPLKALFTKIVAESALGYAYAPEANVVTIFSQDPKEIAEDVFVAKYSTLTEILPTLEQFQYDITGIEFSPDVKSNAIFLKGAQKKVSSLIKILEKVDEAIKTQRQQELEEKENHRKMSRLEQEQGNDSIDIKVIPLRFATVGKQNISFQGESVTLPGILDSLRAFMASSDKPMSKPNDADFVAHRNMAPPPPLISSDQRTNSIILQGTPQQIRRLEEILITLDQPVPLVEIEVLIIDGEANVLRKLGVQWGIRGNMGNAAGQTLQEYDTLNNTATDIIAPTKQSGSYVLGSRPNSEASNTTIGFIYNGTREVLDANLEMLSSDNRLQTVASPRIITLNNQAAKITNAKNISFVVTTGDGSQTDIKTVNAGITLDITPTVIEPKKSQDRLLLRLKVNIKNSSITAQTGNSVNTDEQEMQTNVILPEGSTFVTGGLFNTRREEVESGVPGLMSLPLFGSLFRYRLSEDRKAETIFLITPRIYKNDDILRVQEQNTPRYLEQQKKELAKSRHQTQHKSELIQLKHAVAEEE